ncbi:hypothetical protein A3C89_00555 [Candidatus Kaiserbacteria bacterium RIFCSPHIGHO2_02_FULL_50_50]|uniref:M23ase beta-sheet core domain-containing protein n=1 Tax=Candidatus Kaiserbacteria bacterium RIFCSPHIGHO2_02_FULL_50_50 TaxID=1798492 RepID=A0A1F6DFP2_9BACT|nr:MAG: hypothetical protein A3C89_00555 [Candidatus Kaiserbacteria bacterium RIFCSPHIGHO2_02_FULL_50_50]OGG88847.1 MAG: hypothetical protein A3G62_02995 [Candidatus Kaiserbacteria bacterium RIFCSPLOWO2_12_FULL_50_10]
MKWIGSLLLGIVVAASFGVSVHAETAEELRAQITAGQNELGAIDAQINALKKELSTVGSAKSTLQNTIKKLETERKKVLADISYTEKRIRVTDLEITELSESIYTKEQEIATQEYAIAEVIRRLNEHDNVSPVIAFLQNDTLGDFWRVLDDLLIVREDMQQAALMLSDARSDLESKRGDAEEKRTSLLALSDEYKDQQQVLTNTTQEKSTLLKQTQNKESEYQKLLKEKQDARAKMEAEMREYESKLQYILDPSSIPVAGTAVFSWPIAKPIITQYFGGTEFAKQNASVYAGRAYHPGVDIGAARGTKILAPADGVVRATGNTDTAKGCWAWGKWTLVDHNNGLSTLYAHQDVQAVSAGQTVTRGSVIGYVGNTGYSTGPHLHFTVYARDAVEVKTFGATACASVPRPTAPTSAYLDPMLYLPAL